MCPVGGVKHWEKKAIACRQNEGKPVARVGRTRKRRLFTAVVRERAAEDDRATRIGGKKDEYT